MSLRQRDYQREARREAFAAWDRGERAHLMAAPTGAGKTLVEAKVADEWVRKNGGRVLVLAQDSRELVCQLAESFRRYTRLSVGIEMGSKRVSRFDLPTVVCATVQTMSRRLADFKRDAFTLIVQDEADHAAAKTWRKVSDHFWAARIFGCTATPTRHDGVRVPFDSAHRATTHQQLIGDGLIAPIEVRDVRVVDRKLIVLPSGEHPVDDAAVARIWKQEGELHEIVEPTLRLAGERATIVFAPTVARVHDLAAMFNRYRAGCARAVWGDMPRDKRTSTIVDFAERRFQFVVNVGVLGRGIDLPFVSCVVMARVTQSRTVYEQAIGRGWRAHPEKDRLLVLDFCENAERLRLVATVALLTGRDADEEIIERAGERIDESGGGDVGAAIDEATRDLIDPTMRERIRAKIAVRTRTVDMLTDLISEEDWRTKTNIQIAREYGISDEAIRIRRPLHIPSPARSAGVKAQEITKTEWRTKSNKQLGREKGIHPDVIKYHRPDDVPSPRSMIRRFDANDISSREWKDETNDVLAKKYRVSSATIKRYRPNNIPSPANNIEWRRSQASAAREIANGLSRRELRRRIRNGMR